MVFGGGVFGKIVIRSNIVNWKWKIGISFVGLFLLIVVSLFWAENQKGVQAFEDVISEAESAGLDFDIAAFREIDVPPSDNFFHTPLFEPLLGARAKRDFFAWPEFDFRGRMQRSRLARFDLQRLFEHPDFHYRLSYANRYSFRQNYDFELWAAQFHRNFPDYEKMDEPQEFLFSVLESEFKDEFRELEEASKRRFSVPEVVKVDGSPFEDDWACGALEYCNEVVEVLGFRITLALELGETRVALDSMAILASIAEGIDATDLVAGYFSMEHLTRVMTESLWIGFSNESWSKKDLEELRKLLKRVQFQKVATEGYAAYFGDTVAFWNAFAKDRELVSFTSSPGHDEKGKVKKIASTVLPKGTLYRNGANELKWIFEEGWKPISDRDFRTFSTMHSRAPNFEEISNLFLDQRIFPVEYYGLAMSRVWVAKQQIELACSVELFQQSHGRYPESIEELAEHGESIPNDPFSDSTMRYRRDGRRYVIYSVGWDGADDGGETDYEKPLHMHWARGDWVWDCSVVPRKRNWEREKDLMRLRWSNSARKDLTEEEFFWKWADYVEGLTVEPEDALYEKVRREKRTIAVRKKHMSKLDLESPSPEEIRRQEIIRAQKEKIRRQREGQ